MDETVMRFALLGSGIGFVLKKINNEIERGVQGRTTF